MGTKLLRLVGQAPSGELSRQVALQLEKGVGGRGRTDPGDAGPVEVAYVVEG